MSAAPLELGVDAEMLFPAASNTFARRRNAARRELLAGLADLLEATLAPRERIRWAARACRCGVDAPATATGWAANHQEKAAVLVTDRRLLLVQLDRRGRPGARREQVRLDQVRGTLDRAWRSWRVYLGDGTLLRFVAVRADDRRRLGELLFARPGAARGRSLEPLRAEEPRRSAD
jgi:hypothetical protein